MQQKTEGAQVTAGQGQVSLVSSAARWPRVSSFQKEKAEGQRDVVPVGLYNSVRTECRSQAGLLGNRVSSRLQLARTQSCPQCRATGSQPPSTAVTVEHSEEPQTQL